MGSAFEAATKITNCPVLLGPGFAMRHADGIEAVGLLELAGFAKPLDVYCPKGMKPAVIPATVQKKEAGRLIQG